MPLNHNAQIYELNAVPKCKYKKGRIKDICHSCGKEYIKRPNSRYCLDCKSSVIKELFTGSPSSWCGSPLEAGEIINYNFMTANEILMKFKEGLAMEDQSEGQDIDLNRVILDILVYLAGKETASIIPQYKNDKLLEEIRENSILREEGQSTILLEVLIGILEKYKILGDEKDGM
jgi:hypothetical protein